MTARTSVSGYDIYYEEGSWRFLDNGEPVKDIRRQRPCKKCGLYETPEGHDACLGTLPEDIVMNACCGHGNEGGGHDAAYVQYWDGSCIRGFKAVVEQHKLMRIRDYKESNL